MNGAEYLLECLLKENVDTVFGYPGGSVIPLFDALYLSKAFQVIRTSHEQGATHAADGYARRSGRVGVCIATSGPGATNTITGIANAYLDSVPIVVITGQVVSPLLGKNSFQEVNMTSITKDITKKNFLVTRADDIGPAVQEAFFLAQDRRPGPIVLDITKDAFMTQVTNIGYVPKPKVKDDRYKACTAEIERAIDLLRNAKRPIIYAGGGVLKSKTSDLLTKLAKQCNIPVMNSIMGLSSFDRTDPLSYGIVGMHGTKETNLYVYEADVIVGLGVRFSDRAIGHRYGFCRNAKIIHIDVDEREFQKNVDAEVTILGDFREILSMLIEGLQDTQFQEPKRWKEEDKAEKNFMPKRILEALQAHFPENTTLVTDVGQHQMWSMMYWKPKIPGTIITSGGLGTMGFGIGAAMGAKLSTPQSPVLLVTGDGSFRMNHLELLTLKTYQVPITIVIFNNQALGMVRQWQAIFNERRYADTDIIDSLNLKYLAKAYGIHFAGSADTVEELERILDQIDIQNEINLIEMRIHPDEGAYPMVAAGSSIDKIIERNEMMLRDDKKALR